MAALKVDPDLCVGCALCVEICPMVFEMIENKAWLIPPRILTITEKLAISPGLLTVTEKLAAVKNPGDCDSCDCVLVVDSCPTGAISLEKN